jgi:hypothetical protein
MIWTLSISKGRPNVISYEPPATKSSMESFSCVLDSLGIIFLAFRGQNVILEIQVSVRLFERAHFHQRLFLLPGIDDMTC